MPFYPPPKPASRAPIWIAILAIGLVVVLGCGGVLVALLLPAVQAAREAARRAQCSNNLKQIGVALLNYESANGALPPATFTDDHGKPMKSWRVAVLPYLEEQSLFQQYDSKQPWDSPQNRALGNRPMPSFRCPSDGDAAANLGQTNYVRVVGKDTVGGMPNEAVKSSDITNGSSNTIMLVEVCGLNINWEEPRDITVDELMDLVAKRQASRHVGGFNVLMADGSVHFISYDIDPETLRAQLVRGRFAAKVERTLKAAATVAGNMAAKRAAMKPPEDVASLIDDLNSADAARRVRATMQLLRTKPSEPNGAVAKALERTLLEDGASPIRCNAARALANWGTTESIPALQEAAQKDSDSLVRSRASKAIQAIKLRQPQGQ
jgi:prepilin-type processing-associated H-X9-DG protein